MELFIPLSVIALIITAFLKSKKTRKTVKLLENIRKSQPEFNYYKILPGEVNNNKITIEEIDKLLRPVIIEKLTFIPNIKNRNHL